jgi:arylsulfatase A-like enzyme
MKRSSLVALVASLAAAAVVALVLVFSAQGSPRQAHARFRHLAGRTGAQPALARKTRRPNIVFVLTDDLSMDLLPYMPEVQALAARGMTFGNYFVSDSLCCPSRSSIFTGDFPHDTGVFTNSGADGGIGAFYAHHDEEHSFNVALQAAGYRTAMMGKYLNGYLEGPSRSPVPGTSVPPGWNEWDVAGWGYPEYDYTLNQDGRLVHYGSKPRDYLTSVLTRRAITFIDRSARHASPFFLELATFTPHSPYVPAPGDTRGFPGVRAPEPPNFDRLPKHAPDWLADHRKLTKRKLRRINRVFRLRVQDVQSVDRMIGRVQQVLAQRHMLNDTYIVFSSDNGLHTGEYRLMPGKLTAFDTDIHVPLVIAGPGVRAGATSHAMTENVDLADTFTQLGGISLASDGHSLTALLKGRTPSGWRDAVLIEHHGPATDPAIDPDAQSAVSGNPPSYEAMRTPSLLYVEYGTGERELYDLKRDPFELDNIVGRLSASQLGRLHTELVGLETCHGGASCWAAAHVAPALRVGAGQG